MSKIEWRSWTVLGTRLRTELRLESWTQSMTYDWSLVPDTRLCSHVPFLAVNCSVDCHICLTCRVSCTWYTISTLLKPSRRVFCFPSCIMSSFSFHLPFCLPSIFTKTFHPSRKISNQAWSSQAMFISLLFN